MLFEYQCDELSSMLSVLYTGDRIAAVAYTLRSGPNLHGWFTALRPGLFDVLARHAAADGDLTHRGVVGNPPRGPGQGARNLQAAFHDRRFAHLYEGTIDANAAEVANISTRLVAHQGLGPLVATGRHGSHSLKMVRGVQGWLEMG